MSDTDVKPWRPDSTKRRRLSVQLKGTTVGYQAGKSRRLTTLQYYWSLRCKWTR